MTGFEDMKLTDLKLDTLANPAFTKIWKEAEDRLAEHIKSMYASINDAMLYTSIRHLGHYPTKGDIERHGVLAVHLDGRREYKWAGKTVAVMHPWEGPLPPRVEIFK